MFFRNISKKLFANMHILSSTIPLHDCPQRHMVSTRRSDDRSQLQNASQTMRTSMHIIRDVRQRDVAIEGEYRTKVKEKEKRKAHA